MIVYFINVSLVKKKKQKANLCFINTIFYMKKLHRRIKPPCYCSYA